MSIDIPGIDRDAYSTVVGIVSAKARGAANDAAALFQAYLVDVQASGRTLEDAWRELASAAIVLLTEQTLELGAERHETSVQAVLELASATYRRYP